MFDSRYSGVACHCFLSPNEDYQHILSLHFFIKSISPVPWIRDSIICTFFSVSRICTRPLPQAALTPFLASTKALTASSDHRINSSCLVYVVLRCLFTALLVPTKALKPHLFPRFYLVIFTFLFSELTSYSFNQITG